jgi:hypothetical protein
MAYNEKEEKNKSLTGDEKIIADARDCLKECIDAESSERAKMADDLRFAALDQWPAEIRKDREGDVENGPRPCLTIDKLNQYIVQVVNDVRQGRPGINVRPQDDEADVETARVLKGVIRNIEDQSSADIAYGNGVENAAKIGLGYFRVTTEYVSDDSFDQELFIKTIPNTFSVYLGPHIMPDGSDAEYGYIVEAVPVEKFRQDFPKAKAEKDDFDSIESSMLATWRTENTITVVEEYKFEREQVELLFLADGTTVPADMYAQWPADLPKPAVQDRRTTFKKKLKWRKMTGVEILDSRDLPGKYIPIVEVIGRETRIDGKRILWGLVRPAKDSLRMYNYFASTITEKMGLSPKTPFIAAKGQLENLEDRWKKANKINYSYLEYNPIDVGGNAVPAPQRQPPTPMEAAYFHFMQVIEHDVQTSLGMFKAAVGETESQQSGRALLALQRESDMGTAHFGANLGISIRHCGRILLDLIPHYYDTKRIVRILGEDGEVQNVQLDPSQEKAHVQMQTAQGIKSIHNPGVGKYDISVESGPSYTTKRLEAATMYVEMAKGASDPASAATLHYLIAKNSDSAGSQEAARALRALLPPPVLMALSQPGQQMPPEAMAKIQQMMGQMKQVQEEAQKLQQENVQLKSGAAVEGAKIKADQDAAAQERALKAAEAQREHDAKMIEMKQESEFAVWKARLEAETKIIVAQISAKGSLNEAALQAETQANIELAKAMSEGPGESSEGEAPAPVLRPIEHLAQLHKQGMDAHAQSMDKLGSVLGALAQHHAALAEHLTKPKNIIVGRIQRGPDGITGASATVQ